MATESIFPGRSVPVGAEPQATAHPKGCCSALIELVQKVFRALIDCLVLVWYAIQHALNCVLSFDPFSDPVFKGNVIQPTTNFARFADLPQYVDQRRNPTTIPPEHIQRANKLGLTAATTITPRPYTKGHCFGNAALFLKTWLQTDDINTTSQLFAGGSPFEGVAIQEAYVNAHSTKYYPIVVDSIARLFSGDSSLEAEKVLWHDKGFDNGIAILDAVAAYLEGGKPQGRGGMASYIKWWVYENRASTISGHYLASIYIATDQLEQTNLHEVSTLTASLAYAGLDIATLFHLDGSASEIFQTLSHEATPGAYMLSLSTYSSTGKAAGAHAIGVIISDEKCYILDSNNCIGWSPRNELVDTLGRLFTQYTGFDYSQDPQGSRPSLGTRVDNFFKERANPPSEGACLPEFGLYRVKLTG